MPTPLALSHAPLVAELALKQKLATIGDYRSFADSGRLMFHGADHDDQLRGAATYVDRILRGTPPKELVINLKTAKALGAHDPTGTAGARGSSDRVMDHRGFLVTSVTGVLGAPRGDARPGLVARQMVSKAG